MNCFQYQKINKQKEKNTRAIKEMLNAMKHDLQYMYENIEKYMYKHIIIDDILTFEFYYKQYVDYKNKENKEISNNLVFEIAYRLSALQKEIRLLLDKELLYLRIGIITDLIIINNFEHLQHQQNQ